MPVVRQAQFSDLEGIVCVHKSAFEGFFLTLLGPRFLSKFYSIFIEHSSSSLIICEDDDNKVVGFAAYTITPDVFFNFMKKKHGAVLGTLMLPAILMHPLQTLRKVIRALKYRGDQTESMSGYALLSSIGVHPSVKGKGIGSQLINFMNNDLRAREVTAVYLTTDVHDNAATLAFYKKLGFSEHSQFTQSGEREMYRLTNTLDN
ncbi:GNAT family N-acetyltransferase [Pseudidiomarina salilacus]|uniref:GNAT family N-acetyltransferase n=1 Tax=Pseudidiomarina salilacus TaxID=3384452 RepID=UPI003984E278